MKKKTRSLILLCAALVVCIGAYIAVSIINKNQAQKTADEAKSTQIYAGTRSAPVSISYETGGSALSFVLDSGKWYVKDNKDFPLNQSSLTGLASALNNLSAVRTLDMPPSLATYGLEKPAYTVTGADSAGNALKLFIGAQNGDNYYAMADGGTNVYTISSGLVGYLKPDLLSMIILDTLPTMSASTIDTMTLSSPKATLTLDKHQNKDGTTTWFIVSGDTYTAAEEVILPEGTEKLPQKFVDGAVAAMAAARFSSCAAFKPSAEDVTAKGFDSPQLTVSVDYTTTTGSGLDQKTEKGTAALEIGGALSDGSGYYARLPGSQQINVLPSDIVTPLLEALTTLGTAK